MTTATGKPTLGDAVASLEVMADSLGWWRALVVGVSISSPTAVDTLFADLPAANDARESASRQQAGPAILLYRALLARDDVDRDTALALMTRVIETGALRFLGRQLHDLDPAAFAEMPPLQREKVANGWLSAFFTSDTELQEVAADTVVFRVTGCALHRLSMAMGHPELTPLFCRADGLFFASREPAVALERPTTLAQGDTQCLFKLTLR